MTQHSATSRPHFSNIIYPTYVLMAPEKVSAMLRGEDNLESAFFTMRLLMNEEYKAYVKILLIKMLLGKHVTFSKQSPS